MRGLALLGVAILSVSTSAPFIRFAAPAPPATIAAVRVAIAAAVLLVVGRDAFRLLATLTRRDRALIVLSGLLFGAHLGVWIASLSFTSTAASVAIVATSPAFAALFGALIGDRATGREWLGIAIAAVGCAVLAGGDWRAGGDAIIGDALALVGAATAAGYFVIGRRMRERMPLAPYLALVNLVAAVGLAIVAAASGAQLVGLPAHSYLGIVGSAVFGSLVGHTLLNLAVRRTPAHLVGLAVLGEPIGASLITWAWFGEQPALHAAVGGAIVLFGIAIGLVLPSRSGKVAA